MVEWTQNGQNTFNVYYAPAASVAAVYLLIKVTCPRLEPALSINICNLMLFPEQRYFDT